MSIQTSVTPLRRNCWGVCAVAGTAPIALTPHTLRISVGSWSASLTPACVKRRLPLRRESLRLGKCGAAETAYMYRPSGIRVGSL